MKTVYSAADPVMAGFIVGVLHNAGIPAHVLQAGLGGAAGELPPNECWARVVVVKTEQWEEARAVIQEYLEGASKPPGADWVCPRCGETSEGQFTQCWQCGCEQPRQGLRGVQ